MKTKKQVSETVHSDITASDIKQCDGFEEINDELAEKIVAAVKVYTEIIYNCFKEERLKEQKGEVISLSYKKNIAA
jgi:hypothetical protein